MNNFKHYYLFGLSVESSLEIKGISPSSPSPPKVTIKLAPIPPLVPLNVFQTSTWQAKPSHFYLDIKSVARYLVKNGNEILIAPYEGACNFRISASLLGTVFGALLWQRGLLLLHASAITNGKITFAISGAPGTGKSTLISCFLKNGFSFLADDLCAFALNADNSLTIQPGPPILKLLPDAAKRFSINLNSDNHELFDNKYRLQITATSSMSATPDALIFIRDTNKIATIRKVRGTEKFTALHDASYKQILIQQLGQRVQHFNCCTLLAHKLTIWEITRNKQLTPIDRMCSMIEQCLVLLSA